MKKLDDLTFLALQLSLLLSYCVAIVQENAPDVTLYVRDKQVVIDNGILQLTISNPEGYLTGISYAGVDNLLETRNKPSNRGYWDVVWDDTSHGYGSITDWYIVLRGSSGFYAYAILEREEEYPASNIYQIRTVYKLDKNKFHYMAISDDRQRIMPMPEDRESGLPLAFREAVLLTNPMDSDFRGEVDDKYAYSSEYKDSYVHGWISFESKIGFWIITPSNEFRSAGPVKQDLTSHVGPTALAMFHSNHYAGLDATMRFKEGEPWKKVFGPYHVYLNTASEGVDVHTLWDDAKQQTAQEIGSWPYEFPMSDDFTKSVQRGSVFGQLLMSNRNSWKKPMPASSAWIGLAAPGDAGSWQTETKGYQFWSQADENGRFLITQIRTGVYNLYAWVPGIIGDYRFAENITVTTGSAINLGDVEFEALRNGPTLWEIGYPDRSAQEFYVPTPSTMFVNKLYTDSDVNRFRQYGLWERYAELYPDEDLVYIVGSSDYRRDWFFAHVTRKVDKGIYVPTTWQIIFHLDNIIPSSTYTLRIALASASRSELQVRFNDPELSVPHFTTKLIGSDNVIARHGIHGLYRLFSIDVSSEWLSIGKNTIFLKQSRHIGPFEGVMYDYIRLEGPPSTK